ncbi:putative regulator of Ty1 transposition protein 103 [Blattamonas nauphoetae]|uniref:Regulator of Ty1 transposition protein 103 n=1 Tax=Blattamonas nauphoetae TaxID=2049346 RepID=A0ABQ9YKT0_9EUKA|nr:putative regulator of Ty1 transposition protein 103 [Blattamonas nauphoetae]
MSGFDHVSFKQKLDTVNAQQDSIEGLSQYIIFQKRYVMDIVYDWENAFRAAEPAKKKILFFVANDVVQKAKRKTLVFSKPFYDAFVRSFQNMDGSFDSSVKDSIIRVLRIWRDRETYSPLEVQTLMNLINSTSDIQPSQHQTQHYSYEQTPYTADTRTILGPTMPQTPHVYIGGSTESKPISLDEEDDDDEYTKITKEFIQMLANYLAVVKDLKSNELSEIMPLFLKSESDLTPEDFSQYTQITSDMITNDSDMLAILDEFKEEIQKKKEDYEGRAQLAESGKLPPVLSSLKPTASLQMKIESEKRVRITPPASVTHRKVPDDNEEYDPFENDPPEPSPKSLSDIPLSSLLGQVKSTLRQ